jgi:hypothetical protein
MIKLCRSVLVLRRTLKNRGIKPSGKRRKASMVGNKHGELPNRVLQGPPNSAYPTDSIQLASPAKARLSLISRHLDKPDFILNTPFSRERTYITGHTSGSVGPISTQTDTMPTQANHPTLLIPGPVEFDDEVLQSMAHYRWVNQFSGFRQHTLLFNCIKIGSLCDRDRLTIKQ